MMMVSILVSILFFYTVTEHSVMVCARECPGSTCISPVWLERCKLSLSLSLSLKVVDCRADRNIIIELHEQCKQES